jgi:fucose permease
MPDGLLGVAWPGIRGDFGLPVDSLGLLLVLSTVGYMTSSFLSGALVRMLGLGRLLAASCGATGMALAAYAFAPTWSFFVAFGLLGGAGAGAIDAGLNTYIDRNHSERLMQWLHASFGVGITMGPAIMTTVLSTVGDWRPGYQIVASAQLTLALAFFATRRLWERPDSVQTPSDDPKPGEAGGPDPELVAERPIEVSVLRSALHLRSLAGMLIFFTYTGVELGLGLWAYTLLTESRGVEPTIAGLITGSYWASFTAGRVLAGLFGSRIGLQRLVGWAIVFAAIGVLVVWLNVGPAATVVGIAVTGFVSAPVFRGLMSGTRNRVEPEHLSNTIGMQIAGAGLGAAVLPAVAGVVARYLGLEAIPGYLFLGVVLLLVLFLASQLGAIRGSADAATRRPSRFQSPSE